MQGSDESYVQEHVDLQSAVINGTPLNEAQQIVESTLSGIMGRISAYSGQQVLWDDVMNNKQSAWYSLALSPSAEDFEAGNVTVPQEESRPHARRVIA